MKIMELLNMLRPTMCAPGKQHGAHGTVVTGLGMMGDTCLCLRCGAEYYEPMSGESHVEACETLWPAIAEARALPGGMNERVAAPDPEFDAWFNGPLTNGSLPSWAKPQK